MTITAVFDHRGRVKKNEPGPIEFRISHARRIYYIGTGIRVRESQFKFGTIVNHDQSDELNDRLRILLTRLEQEVNKILQSGQAIDVASIKRNLSTEFVDRRKNNNNDLLEWVDEQIPLLKLKEGTRKHYHTFACTISFGEGIPKEVLQVMMGHSSIRTTELYAKLPIEFVTRNLDKKLFHVWG